MRCALLPITGRMTVINVFRSPMRFEHAFSRLLAAALLMVAVSTTLGAKPHDISFEGESYDFGEVEEGASVSHTYIFRNTGTATLVIDSVRPSCGCTTAGDWDRTVLPGRTGRIPVTFVTQRFNGEVTKVIDVGTNVPERRTIRLEIRGRITIPIDVVPFNTWLGEVTPATDALEGRFEITNNTARPIDIIEVVPPDSRTSFTFSVIEKHKKYALSYSVIPPFDGKETVGKKFTLRTNDKKIEYVYPQFFYRIPLPLKVSPRVIEIDARRLLTESVTEHINVRSTMEKPVRILELRLVGGKGMTYSIEERTKDKHYRVSITIPKGYAFAEGSDVRVMFKVKNDPEKLLYQVPVTTQKK